MFLLIIWVHFVADFVLQSDKMASNKSNSIKWLTIHCLVYTTVLMLFGWKFAILNGILHFTTDFVTSKVTATLWKSCERHWFFVVVGLDQAIHTTTLFLTSDLVVNIFENILTP